MKSNTALSEVLLRLSENQIALGAAIEECAKWVSGPGSSDVTKNTSLCLSLLDSNHLAITEAIDKLGAD